MSTPINNGGPAFPIADTVWSNGQVQCGFNGMSLRDFFAAKALQGILASRDYTPYRSRLEEIEAGCLSRAAFMLADACSKHGRG